MLQRRHRGHLLAQASGHRRITQPLCAVPLVPPLSGATPMRHPCPQCSRKYDLRTRQLGQEVVCPNCQTRFILEDRPTWTPEEGAAPVQEEVLQWGGEEAISKPSAEREPTAREAEDEPDWGKLDPTQQDRESFARQARIKKASGQSISQIRSWLMRSLVSTADVDAIIDELNDADPEHRWAYRLGVAGIVVGACVTVAVVVLLLVVGGDGIGLAVRSCVSGVVLSLFLGFFGSVLGAVIDHSRRARRR